MKTKYYLWLSLLKQRAVDTIVLCWWIMSLRLKLWAFMNDGEPNEN